MNALDFAGKSQEFRQFLPVNLVIVRHDMVNECCYVQRRKLWNPIGLLRFNGHDIYPSRQFRKALLTSRDGLPMVSS
jgi:hypothetical protein